jgi:hypothetical protein
MTFTYNDEKHEYRLDDELLPGVTTILGTLSKPALIQWAANMACDYINSVMIEGKPITLDVIKEARTAHAKKRDKAAGQGTDVHAEIEKYIKSCIADGVTHAHSVNEAHQVSRFVDWAMTNAVVFHDSERVLHSVEHKFAGTCDFTATVGGRKLVGDIKTTSGIYDLSPFLQCAAYQIMLREAGETGYVGSVIIRLGKDGTFEEFYRNDDLGEDMETFLSLLKVYKQLTKFKNQQKTNKK